MTILQRLSKHKAQIHRGILLVQALSPILMFAGALAGITVLIVLGLAVLVIANLLAIVTA